MLSSANNTAHVVERYLNAREHEGQQLLVRRPFGRANISRRLYIPTLGNNSTPDPKQRNANSLSNGTKQNLSACY